MSRVAEGHQLIDPMKRMEDLITIIRDGEPIAVEKLARCEELVQVITQIIQNLYASDEFVEQSAQ